MTYLDFSLEADPDVIAQLGFAEMASRIPGWDPIPGEIDTALIQSVARMASAVRAGASVVPIGVFRYLATQFGLTPLAATPATEIGTVIFRDSLGHTVPAGTLFYTVSSTTGLNISFYNLADIVCPAASSSVPGVAFVAVTAGTEANFAGLSVVPIDANYSLVGATITTAAAGGTDAETDDEFLARLVTTFALMSPAPILPNDFALLALQAGTPAARTIAVDGYDAVALTSGNAKTITVVALDANGAALSAPNKALIVAYLAARREVNWLIYCIDPVFAQISVKFTAHALPGFTASTVLASAVAAVTAYLSAANWGVPALDPGNGWTNVEGWDKVRLGELYQVLNAVDGLAYVDTLFLKAGAVAPTVEVADITLTGGPVVVPTPGSITGTVT